MSGLTKDQQEKLKVKYSRWESEQPISGCSPEAFWAEKAWNAALQALLDSIGYVPRHADVFDVANALTTLPKND